MKKQWHLEKHWMDDERKVAFWNLFSPLGEHEATVWHEGFAKEIVDLLNKVGEPEK